MTNVEYSSGNTVSKEYIEKNGYEEFFSIQPIPDNIFTLMNGKTFKPECTILRSDLRYITCLHKDIEGTTKMGEMVVHEKIAERVLSILKSLYEASYPIERMRLIDYYDADDELSMSDNNSSAFNFRLVSHTNIVSQHGLGLAVDINPLYNPYHKVLADGTEVIEPKAGYKYLDRNAEFNYKIEKGDLCHRLFVQNGFSWGGSWENRKDYQHFEYIE